jgi:hypothetical protein
LLLRLRTKETTATILFLILLTSALYLSGICRLILSWLDFPEFQIIDN